MHLFLCKMHSLSCHIMSKKLKKHLTILFAFCTIVSCTSIDCPLDSVVVMTLTFHDTETEAALPCTLNVEGAGAGVLYNEGKDLKSVPLPMSIGALTDTLYLMLSDNNLNVVDTLYVNHTNEMHFEAMDCPGAVFHHITEVRLHPHALDTNFPVILDSVSIIRPLVDYNDVENIRIYYHLPADNSATSSVRR